MKEYIYEKFNIYLVIIVFASLIPAFLITGPFLGDFTFSIISIIFLIYIIYNKNFFFFKNKVFLIFLTWCIYLIVLSLFSENLYLSLQASLFYFRFGFGALAIAFFFNKVELSLRIFNIFLICTFVVLLFDSFFQFFNNFNLFGFEKGERLSSFFGEEKKLGSFIIRTLPILIFLNIEKIFEKNFFKYFLFLIIILSFFVIFFTLERNALFLSILFLITFFIFLIKYDRKFTFLFIAIIMLFGAFLSNEKYNYRILNTLNNINILDSNNQVVLISHQYQAHFVSSFRMFIDKPIIGHGPKMFRILCKDDKYVTYFSYPKIDSCSTHPHHLYLQLLSETGIIGALPVIILFLFSLFKVLKIIFIKNPQYSIKENKIYFLYILILLNLFPLSTSGNFFNNWISIIYFLPIIFIIFERIRKT